MTIYCKCGYATTDGDLCGNVDDPDHDCQKMGCEFQCIHCDRQAEIEKSVREHLEKLGFFNLDQEPDNTEIWRQKDDEPKMDIHLDFIRHNDDL